LMNAVRRKDRTDLIEKVQLRLFFVCLSLASTHTF
jgi:hypothetical protein